LSNIYIAGFMGAGKTTVGLALARLAGMAFLDLDEMVELTAGTSVESIFRLHGEAFFRGLERQAVARVSTLCNTVVALGGGTLEDSDSLTRLEASGTLVLLEVSPEEAVRRAAGKGRPLLENRDEALARQLMEERAPRYRQCRYQVATDGQDPQSVAQRLAETLGLGTAGLPRLDPYTVPVRSSSGTYEVHIGAGHLHTAGRLLEDLGATAGVVLASEPLALALFGRELSRGLESSGLRAIPHLIPGTEASKSLDEVSRFYDRLVSLEVDRDTYMLCLGGGVVGDTAGYAASTYMRGIPFGQCPTTLLAQVDSSVGGKVAVNHPGGKNLVGSFYQPRLVLADTLTLASLPEETLAEGLSEVVKGALLSGEESLCFLEQHAGAILARSQEALTRVVRDMVTLKARIVEVDERDTGVRKTLNLGHTLAHALESATGYEWSHGRAVAVGLVWACTLGESLGAARKGLTKRVVGLLERFGLPTRLPGVAPEDLVARMRLDKKASGGQIQVVIPRGPGDVVLSPGVPESDMVKAMETLL
jgi:3-dehydroquinate synthase